MEVKPSDEGDDAGGGGGAAAGGGERDSCGSAGAAHGLLFVEIEEYIAAHQAQTVGEVRAELEAVDAIVQHCKDCPTAAKVDEVAVALRTESSAALEKSRALGHDLKFGEAKDMQDVSKQKAAQAHDVERRAAAMRAAAAAKVAEAEERRAAVHHAWNCVSGLDDKCQQQIQTLQQLQLSLIATQDFDGADNAASSADAYRLLRPQLHKLAVWRWREADATVAKHEATRRQVDEKQKQIEALQIAVEELTQSFADHRAKFEALVPHVRPYCVATLLRSTMSVHWHPDGTTLAFGSGVDVEIWDADIQTCLATLTTGHIVHCVQWHPDGVRLAATSGKGSIITIWDTGAGICLATLRADTAVQNASEPIDVHSVQWHPDGIRLVAGYHKKTIIPHALQEISKSGTRPKASAWRRCQRTDRAGQLCCARTVVASPVCLGTVTTWRSSAWRSAGRRSGATFCEHTHSLLSVDVGWLRTGTRTVPGLRAATTTIPWKSGTLANARA